MLFAAARLAQALSRLNMWKPASFFLCTIATWYLTSFLFATELITICVWALNQFTLLVGGVITIVIVHVKFSDYDRSTTGTNAEDQEAKRTVRESYRGVSQTGQ